MIKLFIVFVFLTSGYTSKYDPGVFEGVVERRQQGLTSHDVGPVGEHIDGFIAVEDCSLINREVLACFYKGCETLLIVDCAGVADGGRAWMQEKRIAGEVSPEIFHRYKIPGEELKMNLYFIEYTYEHKRQPNRYRFQ